jgi:hypothetical protein
VDDDLAFFAAVPSTVSAGLALWAILAGLSQLLVT